MMTVDICIYTGSDGTEKLVKQAVIQSTIME